MCSMSRGECRPVLSLPSGPPGPIHGCAAVCLRRGQRGGVGIRLLRWQDICCCRDPGSDHASAMLAPALDHCPGHTSTVARGIVGSNMLRPMTMAPRQDSKRDRRLQPHQSRPRMLKAGRSRTVGGRAAARCVGAGRLRAHRVRSKAPASGPSNAARRRNSTCAVRTAGKPPEDNGKHRISAAC